MGRRAKKAPVQTKKRPTLAKRFKCPFCANENVVECKMDHRAGTGSLSCRLCGASYQMPIHHLHEPVDVFSEWLDDCEAAERNGGIGGGAADPGSALPGGGGGDRYDEDDDIDEPSGLHGGSTKASRYDEDDERAGKQSRPQQKESIASLGLEDSDDDSD
uniref:Transcription elongation factor 1 homolog n=1 Tax=Helicotheca tamesis TaxID=374047 RepID=A0A7S2IG22_9STRA|mmetsp:Transcript_8876/g.12271  ORF Transcript_8876/g.12271 Transcript_8876/m.12271 type:complete len:160 (+) Transcript_8876:100-579(+)|eukprot:CAMPEP_0185723294 /NCGR_PEP_ID=MMETSP1171-20130828/186_1 /TAXON_ID=374046 /ORGANISM="Helicotheca tamensis, Strain CCMP826" /LENGTH=159 /DNA_ID=CAMNT_0028390975 /DNA_START=64 /DNA_END=543 /DNA_ORIENTATION=+